MYGFEDIATRPEQVLDLAMDGQYALCLGNRFEPSNLALFLPSVLVRDLSPLVPTLGHQDVENITVLVNGSPQVDLPSVDLQEQLIYVPDVSQSASLLADCPRVSWPEFQTPEANYFVGDDDPSFRQQILDTSEAECESVVEPDSMTDDLGGETVTPIAWFHSRIVDDRRST